jgi:hypothetical protein
MIGNSLQCEYIGWGNLEQFRSRAVAENEALIFTPPAGNAPILIHGFLDCLRSPELQEGVTRVLNLSLNQTELQQLQHSSKILRQTIEQLNI